MEFKYEIKGITLNECDMYEIKEYYEAHCTAEYIADNYDVTDEDAVRIGYKVRRLMDKYDITEEEAIYEIMKS